MSVALSSRLRAPLALALLASSPLARAAAPAGHEPLAQCRAIADAAERLACFDRLASSAATSENAPAGPGAAVPVTVPAPLPAPAAAVPAQLPAAAPVQNFGADVLPPAEVAQPKAILATVVGSIRGVRRGMVLTLDNGQQWRVVDDHEYDVELDAAKVRLDRNLIGTYWLELLDAGYRFKVRRIK